MIDGIPFIAQLDIYSTIAIAFVVLRKYLADTLTYSLILVRRFKVCYVVIIGRTCHLYAFKHKVQVVSFLP